MAEESAYAGDVPPAPPLFDEPGDVPAGGAGDPFFEPSVQAHPGPPGDAAFATGEDYRSDEKAYDAEMSLDANGQIRRRLSQRPSERYEDKPIITRLHMLEFLSEKEWWYNGQTALSFTLALWFIFIFIMYTRAGVSQSYDLHLSVAQHMENIVAHPHLSGIRVRAVEDNPVPCRCACQSSSAGMPKGPCDSDASETLDFLGSIPASWPRLPQLSVAALLSAQIDPNNLGDKLDTGNSDIEPMTWNRINQPADVWFWVEHGFLPDVWRARSQGAGNVTLQGLVAQKNLIIGGVRARQKRATWSPSCEDKVSPALGQVYRTDCRSAEDDSSTRPSGGSNATGSAAFSPSTAPFADGYYDSLFDIELPIKDALATATLCRDHHWVDGATRELTLQTVTLNAEIGMFALVDVMFKFPAGGGVEKEVKVHTIHATGSKITFTDIIPELMWAFMIVVLLRQEITQMCFAGWRRECLDYWLDMWCIVDWISIICAILISIFWLWQVGSIGTISTNVAALPRAPFAAGNATSTLSQQPTDISAYRTQWQVVLDDTKSVYERKQYYQLCMFWYNMILTCRFLKGFLAQAKLAMLQMTVGTTFWDLCHLLIFFTMLFLNFQLGGYILFGCELEEWSTMTQAGATSVKMMLGNYQFQPMFDIAPVSATCWFWGFLLTMVFILMNLIFAMTADYFHVIRGSMGDTDSLWQDSKNAVVDLWWRLGWRKINLEDREWKMAFIENPYNEVVDGLMEGSELKDTQMERDSHHTCLGVRLGRRHMEALSIEGLDDKQNAGFVEATSKGIQEYGADIMAADHLLELATPHVEAETRKKNQSQLTMVRHFLTLLRNHRAEMDLHCLGLETEVTDDHSKLVRSLDTLEVNVRDCLTEFERLKEEGVHSLAPPLQALPRPGTLAAKEAQAQSLVAPGAMLRAVQQRQFQNASPQKNKGQAAMAELMDSSSNAYTNAMLMNTAHSNGAMVALANAGPMALGNAMGSSPPPRVFDNSGGDVLRHSAAASAGPSSPLRSLRNNQPADLAIGNEQPGQEYLPALPDNVPDNQALAIRDEHQY